uniref:Uncharacterized protein n=1 Tax=Rhizophora mucronata TaxID=61149 RepID=A0A2P2N956_RHIMU
MAILDKLIFNTEQH